MAHHDHADPHHAGAVVHDDWFDHSGEAPPKVEVGAHIRPGAIGWLFAVLAAAVVFTIVVVVIFYMSQITSLKHRLIENTEPADDWYAMRLSAEEAQRADGTMDRAFQRVLEQYNAANPGARSLADPAPSLSGHSPTPAVAPASGS